MSSKRALLIGGVMAVVFCATSIPAAAQFRVNINVDENGNGTLTNTNGFFANLPFAMATDPGPGGRASVAEYGLQNPPGLVGGDVVLLDSGVTGDLLRFNPAVNGGSLFFYSDQDGGIDALADTGMPDGLNTNVVRLSEGALSGGGFGFVYTPTAGQPGFVTGAAGPVVYTLISDSVPEPASIILTSSALVLLFLLRRWRPSSIRS
jgi:hypothetical protein